MYFELYYKEHSIIFFCNENKLKKDRICEVTVCFVRLPKLEHVAGL